MREPTQENKVALRRWERYQEKRDRLLDTEHLRTYCGHCGDSVVGLMRDNNDWWEAHNCAKRAQTPTRKGRRRAGKRRAY